MFKKLTFVLFLLFLTVPVYASSNNVSFKKLTVTMPIPEGLEMPEGESFFYGFKGKYSDAMAELNAENNYTFSVDIPQGDYELYQIHDAAGFGYRTVINQNFTISDNKTLYVYIQEKSGNYINADLIPNDSAIESLSAYGTADTIPEDDGYGKPTTSVPVPEKPNVQSNNVLPIVISVAVGLIGLGVLAFYLIRKRTLL